MKKLLFSNQPIAQDLGLLLLRLSAGGIMAYSHGWGKLQSLFSGEIQFANPIGIGEEPSLFLTVFAEFLDFSRFLNRKKQICRTNCFYQKRQNPLSLNSIKSTGNPPFPRTVPKNAQNLSDF